MVIVAAAFAIAMLVQAFLVKPFTIHQVSMGPTLEEGDRILLNRLAYHFRDPQSGDIDRVPLAGEPGRGPGQARRGGRRRHGRGRGRHACT